MDIPSNPNSKRKKHEDPQPVSLPPLRGKNSDDSAPRNKLLSTYQLRQSEYEQEGITQHSQLLLRKIAGYCEVGGNKYRLIDSLSHIAKQLMMNDLEIVGWSIYISRLVLKEHNDQLQTHLIYAGVAAKYYFDDDIKMIQAFLERTTPNFTNNYNDWFRSHAQYMRISPKELNDCFKKLSEVEIDSEPKVLLDYNSLVEEVLKSTPLHTQPEEQLPPLVPIAIRKPKEIESTKERRISIVPEDPEQPVLGKNPSTGSSPDIFHDWSGLPELERLQSLTKFWPDKEPETRNCNQEDRSLS